MVITCNHVIIIDALSREFQIKVNNVPFIKRNANTNAKVKLPQ